MKATIDGIVVEGTPEEIVLFKKLYDEEHLNKKQKSYINPFKVDSQPLDAISTDEITIKDKSNPYTILYGSDSQ